MSQFYVQSTSGGGGGSNVQQLTPDTGGAVTPVANNINVFGKTSSVNNNNGIQTANGGAGELDIRLTNRLQGTGSTVGAVTADIITFSLGATPGTFKFKFNMAAFESGTPSGAGYEITASFRTTGAAATVIQTPDFDEDEEAALATADWDVIGSGNNVILRVTGVLGLTIQWSAVGYYVFAS